VRRYPLIIGRHDQLITTDGLQALLAGALKD
jgi:hypothetical protein